ncbi:polysaccharide biosynthesis protein [Kitasatospora sp. LaBMicrA B282]|uniref:polysaccharide biosynthesis protein n=1 Tax=Kitasatospora sp. LaBMicrA B282 TaxID=3420949 RepID=UPI003D0EC198
MTAARPPAAPAPLRTLVVGAGEAGRALARDLLRVPQFGLRPVGFLDDDPGKGDPAGAAVDGVRLPLLGPLERTGALVAAHRIEVVVVAIPGLPPHRFARVAEAAAAAGASVRYLPSFIAALRRDVVGGDLRALDVNQLIGRQEVHVVGAEARRSIAGRRVLVTGAGGSIGSELCRQVHAFAPSRLFLLDHDESNLHRLQLELFGAPRHDEDLVICDIRDRSRLEHVFDRLRPEVVFHAAAHKHLPMLELHPCEGVKSNVLGTDRLVRVASRYGVERFVLISTDKAADPISVLGATKRLAELIVQAGRDGHGGPAGPSGRDGGTVCTAVRFGNVLGSRGSLLDVLAAQLRSGRPVTVTHPDMTRFFMTIEEAAGLVLEAGRLARGGEVFVLDMGRPVRILDLVQRYARQLNAGPPRIRFTGLRPGEKLDETLFSVHERRLPTAHPRIHATAPRDGYDARAVHRELPGLYAAAWQDDATEVRRRLARLLPGFPLPEPAAPDRQLVGAVPYPDDF